MTGRVYIMGAGCGSSDMMSLRAFNVLRSAEAVVYDRILGDGVFELIPECAEKINAGKASGKHLIPQYEINKILLEKAKEGKIVVRLKGGDPFLFGRGGEEAEFLYENNIPFEVIPGISSAFAAPELAGIPLTHRGFSSAVHILTGHFKYDKEIDYTALKKSGGTYVFLMGLKNAEKIQNGFLAAGLDKKTPCAVIENGGTSAEHIGLTELSQLAETAENFVSPSIIVIGEVCTLHKKLYSKKPLWGRNIIIARPFERGEKLKKRLETEGARASIVPGIKITSFDIAAKTLVDSIKNHKYIVFTSRTGVGFIMDKLFSAGYDSHIFGGKIIAVTGGGTAEELKKYGIKADLMPENFYTEDLAYLLISENADN
ncbi:MAG: uroporphyrinogen-III C-methyltransferase, partial [Firmicutes bacterium]|nr:uroporphyrinogen-III C-methyltransferase [Bacillota bacterium]